MSTTSGPETPATGEAPVTKKHVNPFLKALMIVFAVPTMIVYESAKSLCRKAYGAYDSFFPTALGIVIALASGIGAGYYLGWVADTSVYKWLPGGILGAALSFFYIWPLLYLGIFKQMFRLSETLWDTVGKTEHYSYGGWFSSGVRSTSWFTKLLLFLGYVSIVLGALYLGWNTMLGVHAKIDWGWFGYVVGFVAGAIIGLAAGAISWAILSKGRLATVTVVTGVGLTYLFASHTQGVVGRWAEAFGLAQFAGGLSWFAYVLEFAIYVAYAFPLVHIIATHGFGWIADALEGLLEKVYGSEEKRSDYRQFFAQVVNIAGAYQLAKLSFVGSAYFALSGWYPLAVAAGVAFLSYLLIGKLLRSVGNSLVGGIASAHSVAFTFFAYKAAGLWFGWVGAIVASAVAGALTFFLVFPLAYLVVRLLAKPLLASWLGRPLAGLHAALWNGLKRVGTELGHSFVKTYDDETPYKATFLHLVNLGALVGVFFGFRTLTGALGFATWLSWATVAASLVLSYLLVGKLLQKAGNELVGILAGLAAGIFVGVLTFAGHAWWVATLVGLVGAALTFGLVFPVVYVVLRAIINVTRPEKWLRPALVAAHDAVWGKFASLWREFLEAYREVRDWFRPTWESFKATWNDTWQQVRQFWNERTGGSR
jgi:hypothetical protein